MTKLTLQSNIPVHVKTTLNIWSDKYPQNRQQLSLRIKYDTENENSTSSMDDHPYLHHDNPVVYQHMQFAPNLEFIYCCLGHDHASKRKRCDNRATQCHQTPAIDRAVFSQWLWNDLESEQRFIATCKLSGKCAQIYAETSGIRLKIIIYAS